MGFQDQARDGREEGNGGYGYMDQRGVGRRGRR
jgi:hypothetical protein